PETGEPTQACFGASGAITRIGPDGVSTYVGGLPSVAGPDGSGATGPHDVSATAADGTLWAVIGDPADPDDPDVIQQQNPLLGSVIQITDPNTYAAVADLVAFEIANNPDQGEVPDSNPYSVWDAGSARIVADAGGNTLLRVEANGTVSVLAVFPPQ